MTGREPQPLIVALDMGYGHLRPAAALAGHLGIEVLHADRPPLAGPEDQKLWNRTRRTYEATTRWSSVPIVGGPFRSLVTSLTGIPDLYPYRDLSAPNWAVKLFNRRIRNGLGSGMARELLRSGRPLLTTHFAPALAADAAGCERIFCVVTDTEIHRIWAPFDPSKSRVVYLAPSMRARRRLRAYGVPDERIEVTGYPLPHELVGGEDLSALKRNLARRIVRLDPKGTFRKSYSQELSLFLGGLPEEARHEPVQITFAVGGAGAQANFPRRFLPGFRKLVQENRIRIALVAGIRPEVAARMKEDVSRAGLEDALGRGVEILIEKSHAGYFEKFNALLARTDVLWTKPSEMTFFGALGLALVLAPPVGMHESLNRRWARDSGAALKSRDPRYAFLWMREWMDDGLLAAAAWSGFLRMPKFGLYRILRAVRGGA